MSTCKHCGASIHLFDKAPFALMATDNGQGWATDESGDPVEDFVCPVREASGRYPDGKPHEPLGDLWPVIEDILGSIKLAQESGDPDIYTTVRDYVANTYGDD